MSSLRTMIDEVGCVCVSTRQDSPQKQNLKKKALKNCLSFDIFFCCKEPKVVMHRCFLSQSRVLCARLMKTLLNKDTEGAIIVQFDGWSAGWNVRLAPRRFGSRKRLSSRVVCARVRVRACVCSVRTPLWLKYLRQGRNVMAPRMWVTVTHGLTDYCVQTGEWPFESRCLPLLCWS